jgi:hypothetical protein
MLHKHAVRLAAQLNDQIDFEGAPEPRDRATHVVRDAVIGTAEIFIPDAATGAVVTREGADGILVATDDRALYAVEGVLPTSETEPGTARCSLFNLDPTRDTVAVEARFRRPWGQIIRETVWRFQIGDLSLEIETKVDNDDLDMPEREAFAQRLAVGLGWSFGGDTGELKVAA